MSRVDLLDRAIKEIVELDESPEQNYVEIESWMEELAGEGEYQGGGIDILTSDEVDGWGDHLTEIMGKVHSRMDHKKK